MTNLPNPPEGHEELFSMPWEDFREESGLNSTLEDAEYYSSAAELAIRSVYALGGIEWRDGDPDTPLSGDRLNFLMRAIIISQMAIIQPVGADLPGLFKMVTETLHPGQQALEERADGIEARLAALEQAEPPAE